MALIRPFRALRPTPAKAAEVAAVPYDVVNREEARKLASDHPLSFLHVSRSEIDLPAETDPYSEAVYKKAESNFKKLSEDHILTRESHPALYVYRLRMGDQTQIGLAACFSLNEYDSGSIRKHERTRKEKEDDRTRHILQLSAQTGPVFLTYRNHPAVEAEINQTLSEVPLYDFTPTDGISHTVWRIESPSRIVQLFADHIPRLYIADGHHRAAAAARARVALKGQTTGSQPFTEEADFFLAVAFPDHQLRIFPYHRLIRDLGALSSQDFLSKLSERFEIAESPDGKTPGPEKFGMFFENRWYLLSRRASEPSSSELDVSLLQELILDPLLGIKDPRTDRRIDFVGGIRGTKELESRVQSGEAKVAFALHPTQMSQMMEIADRDGIMPPKSTWFEPKLRDGLLIHTLV